MSKPDRRETSINFEDHPTIIIALNGEEPVEIEYAGAMVERVGSRATRIILGDQEAAQAYANEHAGLAGAIRAALDGEDFAIAGSDEEGLFPESRSQVARLALSTELPDGLAALFSDMLELDNQIKAGGDAQALTEQMFDLVDRMVLLVGGDPSDLMVGSADEMLAELAKAGQNVTELNSLRDTPLAGFFRDDEIEDLPELYRDWLAEEKRMTNAVIANPSDETIKAATKHLLKMVVYPEYLAALREVDQDPEWTNGYDSILEAILDGQVPDRLPPFPMNEAAAALIEELLDERS